MVGTLVYAGVACLPKIRASGGIGQMPKPRGLAHRARSLTLKELSEHFHLPINDVARKLGLCVTVLKQRCREHGITRWPYRKVRKLDNMISALETNSSGCGGGNSDSEEEKKKRLETVKETRSYLLANPNSSAHLRLGKVKYLCKRSGVAKEDVGRLQRDPPINRGHEMNDVGSDKDTVGCSRKLLSSHSYQGKSDLHEKTAKRPRTSVGSSVTSVNLTETKARLLPGNDEDAPPCPTFMPGTVCVVMASEFPLRERVSESGCLERIMQNAIPSAKDRSESSACSLNGPMTELALSQGSVVDDEPDIHLGMSPTAKVRARTNLNTTGTTGNSPAPVSPSSEGSKETAMLEMRGGLPPPSTCNSSNGYKPHSPNMCVTATIGIGSIATPNVCSGGPYAGAVAGPGFISSGRLSAFRPLGKKMTSMYSNRNVNGDIESRHELKVALPADRGYLNDTDKVSGVASSDQQQRGTCSGNSVSTSFGGCVVGASVRLTLATGGRGITSSPPPSPKQGSMGRSGCTSESHQPEHDATPLLCKLDAKASGSLCTEANSEDQDVGQERGCFPVISLSLNSDPDEICQDQIDLGDPVEQVKKGTSQGSHDLFMLGPLKVGKGQVEQRGHLSICRMATRFVDHESYHEGSADRSEKPDVVDKEDGDLSPRTDSCINQPGSAKSVSSPASFAVSQWQSSRVADEKHEESAIHTVEVGVSATAMASTAGMSSCIQPAIEDANTCLTMSTCSANSVQEASSLNLLKHSGPSSTARPRVPSALPMAHNVSQSSSGPPSPASLATQHWLSPLLFPSSDAAGGTSPSAMQFSSSLLSPLVLGMSPLGTAISSVPCTNIGGGSDPFAWAGISRMMPWTVGLHEMIGGMAGLVAATSSIRRAAVEVGGWGSSAGGESAGARKASEDSGNGPMSSVDCNSSMSISGLGTKRF